MKKILFIIIFTFSIIFVSKAQFSVKIYTSRGNDTIKTCSDSSITFYAVAKYGADTIKSGLNFTWNFGDGNTSSQLNLDTITHQYLVSQMYRVLLTAKNDTLWANDVIVVQLGLDPWFNKSKTDIPKNQNGICNGETVSLSGSAQSHIWKEKRETTRTEIFPQYVDDTHPYSSYITRKDFSNGQKITAATDIDSIGIKIEHSDASNLKITLSCPNGQSVVLKDSGGVQKALGEPITTPGDYSEGVGYNYFWTNSPTYGTISTYSGSSDTIPAGTYTPDENFSTLIGCPLNGNWTIKVQDLNADSNDGYVFSWSLLFNPNIENNKINYTNTYNINSSFWSGDGANLTSDGVAEAIPEGYGNHHYKFYIYDNWGCVHDTSLNVLVEQANFDIDKRNVVIGDSIHVQDKTSWADSRTWDFGDTSDLFFDKSEYKKYKNRGVYSIKMTAKSKSGCTDFDTAQVTVVPKPIKIEAYNIFSPNGDGINDVFNFFNTPDEKITAANIDQISAKIYNRYGEVVCKWTSQEEILKGWDGTIRNKGKRKAPAGFYYYVLIIKGKDGIKYKPFSGFIYLYRSK